MTINSIGGKFQASYWSDADKIGDDPDGVEYSDFPMELKQRIHGLFRQGRFAYAAIFQWNADAGVWELLDEFEPGIGRRRPE